MDDAEIRRGREALQSRIDELTEALRRLTEIEEEAQIHEHDDGQLSIASGAVSSNSAGSLLQHGDPVPVPVASGDQDPDDLYPLVLGAPFDEPEEDATQLGYQENDHDIWTGPVHRAVAPGRLYVPSIQATSVDSEQPYHDGGSVGGVPVMAFGDDFYLLEDNSSDEPEYPILWDYHLYNQAVYDTFAQQPTTDGAEHLEETGEASDHGGLLSNPALYDDDDRSEGYILQAIATGEATPVRFSDGGFGGVPASAAAIAGLKKQRYDGSGADNMCVICMRDFKKGKRLYVMPCAYMHRFHRKCLKKWLSRSNVCPLCRHALPTEEQGVQSSAIYFDVN